MLRKIIRRITGEYRRERKLVSALNDFLDYNQPEKRPNFEEAKKNLEDGVIEIRLKYSGHESNGLLLTEDGYFLTAKHCVEPSSYNYFRLVNKNNSLYPIEKVCAIDKDLDLAIVKATMEGDCLPRRYRFYDKPDYESGLPVTALSRWDDKLINETGYTEREFEVKNIISSTVPVFPGYSGGLLINSDAEIMGIISGMLVKNIAYFEYNKEKLYLHFEITNSIAISSGLDLINSYKKEVESRL